MSEGARGPHHRTDRDHPILAAVSGINAESQRVAMLVRGQTCATRGCEHPASKCHAHHLTAWAEGGRTSVKAAVWFCPRHHTLAHHDDHQLTRHPDGTITYTRRE